MKYEINVNLLNLFIHKTELRQMNNKITNLEKKNLVCDKAVGLKNVQSQNVHNWFPSDIFSQPLSFFILY